MWKHSPQNVLRKHQHYITVRMRQDGACHLNVTAEIETLELCGRCGLFLLQTQRWSSAYLVCNKWLFELPLPLGTNNAFSRGKLPPTGYFLFWWLVVWKNPSISVGIESLELHFFPILRLDFSRLSMTMPTCLNVLSCRHKIGWLGICLFSNYHYQLTLINLK